MGGRVTSAGAGTGVPAASGGARGRPRQGATRSSCAVAWPADEALRVREQRIGDIADSYRGQLPYDELKRVGRDVCVTVDHEHRLILVSSFQRQAQPFLDRIPPEAQMEFDDTVLEAVRAGLANSDHVVILDTSDGPGYGAGAAARQPCLTARVTVVALSSGTVVGDPTTVAKPAPHLPALLHERLLAVPAHVNNDEQREYVAQLFLYGFLTSCIAAGSP